jgi:hypothetical protein
MDYVDREIPGARIEGEQAEAGLIEEQQDTRNHESAELMN